LLASILGLNAVVGLLPADTPRLGSVRIDATVLAFCVAATLSALAMALLATLVPAVRAGRADPVVVLAAD